MTPSRILLGVYVVLICLFIVAPIISITAGALTETAYVVFPPQGLTLKWYEAALGHSMAIGRASRARRRPRSDSGIVERPGDAVELWTAVTEGVVVLSEVLVPRPGEVDIRAGDGRLDQDQTGQQNDAEHDRLPDLGLASIGEAGT